MGTTTSASAKNLRGMMVMWRRCHNSTSFALLRMTGRDRKKCHDDP
jgi:hypothetical protein